ncbi:MAG: hypothetical protein R3F48_06960 [Candidatus Zixiibacteriota bacterium]
MKYRLFILIAIIAIFAGCSSKTNWNVFQMERPGEANDPFTKDACCCLSDVFDQYDVYFHLWSSLNHLEGYGQGKNKYVCYVTCSPKTDTGMISDSFFVDAIRLTLLPDSVTLVLPPDYDGMKKLNWNKKDALHFGVIDIPPEVDSLTVSFYALLLDHLGQPLHRSYVERTMYRFDTTGTVKWTIFNDRFH